MKSLHLPIMSEAPQASSNMPRQVKIPSFVATELGVFAELKKRCSDKKFYAVGNTQICPNMKKVTLDKLIEALENEENEVLLSEQEISDAHAPLLRMLELAK